MTTLVKNMEFIPIASPRIGEEEAKAVYNVVRSGWVSMGPKVREFEDLVCEYTGAKYAVAMNNGTSTLHALLIALDVGPGDEVIVPSLTYISSANVVMYQGADLILCDSDTDTFNTHVDYVREKITSRTKAIITVDMKGSPVDFDNFQHLSLETGIPVISDSAESFGAIYKNRKVGTQLLAHSFSFFANKNMTTGEGGMVVTNDESLYKHLLIIRNQGQEGRYNHTYLGNNFRMTDVCAAIGIEQLKKIDYILNSKVALASYYDGAFEQLPGISVPIVPQFVNRPSWYLYSIKLDMSLRDSLAEFLRIVGIETRTSFPPVHIQPYYVDRFKYEPHQLESALTAFKTCLDIPIWADMGQERQDYIIQKIRSFISVECGD
jgi:perosamine synthetase